MVISPLACISDDDFLPLDPIPEISAWIPNRLVGLRVAFFVRRTHGQRITPWCFWHPRRLPGAEGVGAMVLTEICGHPVLSPGLGTLPPRHCANAAPNTGS